MLKGVIFDLDGVVIDSHPIHKVAWKRFLSSVGKEVTEGELDFILDGRKKEEILRHFLGDLSREQLREYGRQKETLFRAQALDINLVEGVTDFLKALQDEGIPMAVATSGSHGRVHHILEQLQLSDCFQAIVTGDDVAKGKPDPSIFLIAGSRLGCSNSDLLVVEDAVSGVKAAKRARMKCLAIASNGRGQMLLKAGADLVVPNFVGLSLQSLHDIGNGHR